MSFRVDGYERQASAVPTNEQAAARLLLQGTFGPTNASIQDMLVTLTLALELCLHAC